VARPALRTVDRDRSSVRSDRERSGHSQLRKTAIIRAFRNGTRLALGESMLHSSSPISASSLLSSPLGARAAVFAPVLIATLSLCSLARAQEPDAALGSATPQPSPQSVPVASPNAPEPSGQPAATASPAPAVRETAPAPAPVLQPLESEERSLHFPTRVHQGFYLRFTSGPSLLSLRGHGPSGASASITGSGASGSIAIGGAIVPGLVLAGTIQGESFNAEFKGGPFADGSVSANGKTRSASHKAEGGVGMVGLLVDWYPKPTGSWHAGFSTGLGGVGLTNSADDSDFGGVNFAGSVFGGYDWALGRNWALGLQLIASGATQTKLQTDFDSHDSHDSGYRLTPLSVGVLASLLYF